MVRKPLPLTAHWHLSALPLACCFFPSLTTCLKWRQPQFYLSYQIALNCQYKQILLHRPSDLNCHHGQKEHTQERELKQQISVGDCQFTMQFLQSSQQHVHVLLLVGIWSLVMSIDKPVLLSLFSQHLSHVSGTKLGTFKFVISVHP